MNNLIARAFLEKTKYGKVVVSTVDCSAAVIYDTFLSMFGEPGPRNFETMVFKSDDNGIILEIGKPLETHIYNNKEEAIEGHRKVVKDLLNDQI